MKVYKCKLKITLKFNADKQLKLLKSKVTAYLLHNGSTSLF